MNAIQETTPGWLETRVTITSELGLHARPAALIARTAQEFTAALRLATTDQEVDAKSILDILSLAAVKGTALTIRGQGEDAENGIEALAALILAQFREGTS